jgi:RNA polymerase sigma-70 factor, ECF subfamily
MSIVNLNLTMGPLNLTETKTKADAEPVSGSSGEMSGQNTVAGGASANAALWADEADIVARAKRDIRDFTPLYDRYCDRIYRYIYRRVGDHEAAEDLTAQTFQQAIAAMPGFEWRGLPFSAWLYRIAGNLVIRHRQIRGREVTMEYVERLVDQQGCVDDPLEVIVRQSSRDALTAAMERLNPAQKRALILKYSHGLKNHEVGTLMNRSEGGVKQLVHRAMIVLRRELRKLEEESSKHML